MPLRQTFDFLAPASSLPPIVGARVKVPFGPRKLVGVITAISGSSDYPVNKLKSAFEVLDQKSVFDESMWETLQWISRYYLAPIGEVLDAALTRVLRQGSASTPAMSKTWALTDHGRSSSIDELNRAPLQLAIVKRFMNESALSSSDFKQESPSWRQAVKALVDKNWLKEVTDAPTLERHHGASVAEVQLNAEQQTAVSALAQASEAGEFSCTLLHGITGSGKTEVYFAAMDSVLAKSKQVLLLVPEIGLTPQLIRRVQQRFSHPVISMHSNLSDGERHLAWWHARKGNAQIIIGTRSAVFSSFLDLGLIIVDEEHDGSFKQQDGVRYQARDVAIYRAKLQGIPIVLGSATPSLESYANATNGRYRLLSLTKRATKVTLPTIELFDLNRQPCSDGLSPGMLEAIRETLARDKQVMLFLNRRGFAPVLYCQSCKQTSKCHRCDSNLTMHRRANRMRCHHCGYEGKIPTQCGHCKSDELVEVGEGTQRVEEALSLRFPDARLLRIDRDSTRRKGELAELLEQAHRGDTDIVLGTQLITKGHDFPNVGMVGILEADQGLYSTDFRASEHLFQQVLQVSGRAGRRDEVGRVFIQTHFPEHPFFNKVQDHDYESFAKELLQERQRAGFPPYGYFALLRSESTHQARALQFLRRARQDLHAQQGVIIMDAVPAPMERRAGRYRAQMLLMANQRSTLNATLQQWLHDMSTDSEKKKLAATVRWNLDIDPLDHY